MLFTLLATMLMGVLSNAATAKNNIPSPPKRPDIVNVPKSYIERLKSRSINKDGSIHEQTDLINLTNQEMFNLLEKKSTPPKVTIKNIYKTPIPKKKPSIDSDLSNQSVSHEEDQTIISFIMEPKKVQINENMTSFLKEYALDILNTNQNTKMQIHSYAKPMDNKEFSDVRLALARALEVRKFMIKNNIDPSRIKLTPMGKDQINDSDDRIDLLFIDTAFN